MNRLAEVVFVHGIGQQEHESGDALLELWVEALASAAGGGPAGWTEKVLERSAMVFYGDLFVRVGAQGGTVSAGDFSDDELGLAEELAVAWIERAAGSATSDRLRREGWAALKELEAPPPAAEAMGVQAVVRSAIAAASRIHFFAEQGFGAAERLLWRDLKQVSSYMAGEERAEILARAVEALSSRDLRAVVAHSLGSVVAYEAVCEAGRPLELLVTIGSPLGLDRPIYRRLRPAARYPPNVVRWVNFADPEDIVAAAPILHRLFPGESGQYVEDRAVTNTGWWRHGIELYFAQPGVVDLVGGLFR